MRKRRKKKQKKKEHKSGNTGWLMTQVCVKAVSGIESTNFETDARFVVAHRRNMHDMNGRAADEILIGKA